MRRITASVPNPSCMKGWKPKVELGVGLYQTAGPVRGSPKPLVELLVLSVRIGPHFCSMKITQDVRDYAAAQGIGEAEALEKGMETKAVEFVKAGAEIYRKV
jgi:hypothetical protein